MSRKPKLKRTQRVTTSRFKTLAAMLEQICDVEQASKNEIEAFEAFCEYFHSNQSNMHIAQDTESIKRAWYYFSAGYLSK